ncbi:DUF6797 domain-containing protein [Verrucomicrobiota bacterium sgz303538]
MTSRPLVNRLRTRVASIAILAGVIAPLALLAQAPRQPQELKWDKMDLGPFHTGAFKIKDQVTAKGIAIKVGSGEEQATVLFDPELVRVSAAWTGGFVEIPRGRGGLEGQLNARGKVAFSTGYAPGWAKGGEIGDDPREKHQGNLPGSTAKWRGIYVNNGRTLLSYTVGGAPVLELPGFEKRADVKVFTRTIQVAKTGESHSLLICDMPGASGSADGSAVILSEQGKVDPAQTSVIAIGANNLPTGAKFRTTANGRAVLDLPAIPSPATFQVVIWSGVKSEVPKISDLTKPVQLPDLAALTKGGQTQWGAPLETKGALGGGDQPYVVDEISLPDDNPFNSWFRPGGHDFFKDGSVALASVSGDVWIVSGLDEKLDHVKWKRFATGLFQPLGVKVVDETVYVLGRDQITRLHDVNKDGEADFYENFNNDCVVTENYHEFALDLQTDSAGNFYYAKGSPWTPTVTSPHQGCLMKVGKDGSKMEVIATGLRAPNGMGMGPNNLLTVSDNQGHWMPANRLNVVKPGGFYGMVPAAHRVLTFKDANGQEYKANPSDAKDQAEHKQQFWGSAQSPIPTEGYDLPLCWIPMQIDNSPGGEVWVPKGDKWGPLGGQMLHMTYGKCALFNVLQETVDGVIQGGLVRFPLKFSSGIMRGRFSPKDGQLYLSGLRVWQSDAAKDGGFYRVRYTGAPATMPVALKTTSKGVELTFTGPLDEKSALDAQNFSVEQWNYLWTGNYGSPDVSVFDPKKKGRDLVLIESIKLSPDKKTLILEIQDRVPAMQMKIKYKINTPDGKVLDQEIYNTVHRIPGQQVAAQ